MTANPPHTITVTTPILEDWAWLARRMRPDEIEQHLAARGVDTYDPNAAALEFATVPGPTFCLVGEDGLPVCAGGFVPLRPGVYEGWMVGTLDRWESHGLALTRAVRRITDRMLQQPGVHRLQITALPTRTQAHAWYERALHYRPEATLTRYCADGQDAIIFARVNP